MTVLVFHIRYVLGRSSLNVSRTGPTLDLNMRSFLIKPRTLNDMVMTLNY